MLINLSSAGVEIAKNLMLSGIAELTILDDSIINDEDLDTNFFINAESIGELKLTASYDKIKELNPRVELIINTNSLKDQTTDFYEKFDLIVATETTKLETVKLNQISRSLKIPFYNTGLHGLYGYIFVDLISFVATTESKIATTTTTLNKKNLGRINSVKELLSVEYKKEQDQLVEVSSVQNVYKQFNEIGTKDTVDKLKEFFNTKRKLKKISIILPCILTLIDNYEFDHHHTKIDDINIEFEDFEPKLVKTLQDLKLNLVIDREQVENFLRQAYTQFQPTGAIIGGAISQDIIQYLSHKQCFNNFVILDAIESKMPIYTI